jgi:hypothetical protein
LNKCEIDRFYTYRNREEYARYRAPHGVKLHPDGRRLYVNVETTDTLLVYDLTAPKCWEPSLAAHVHRAALRTW